jgi:hypothetical protein
MKYRVAFEKRSRADGQQSAIDPTLQLDAELAEGVVAEKTFVEWLESDALHSQDVLDEDDAFLGLASAEVWEYDIVAGKTVEFEEAMTNSEVVLEFTVVDETDTPSEDASPVPLRRPVPIPSGVGDASESDEPPDKR